MIQGVEKGDGFAIAVALDEPHEYEFKCIACGRRVHNIDFTGGRAMCVSDRLPTWEPEGCAVDPTFGVIRAIPLQGAAAREVGPLGYEQVGSGKLILPEQLALGIRARADERALARYCYRVPGLDYASGIAFWSPAAQRWEIAHPTDPQGARVGITTANVRPFRPEVAD